MDGAPERIQGEVMGGTRRRELEFGADEKLVRWFEESSPEALARELPRKLGRAQSGSWDPWLRAAALAAARSVRHDGPRTPQSLPVLAAVRGLLERCGADEARSLMTYGLRAVNAEIHSPGFGPFRLQPCDEVAGEGREGTLFSFLEAIRAGEADWADHRFAWLVKNLEKDEVVDLLLSSGLEGVSGNAGRVVLVVDTVALLQGLGWELAATLLRPAVRHQAGSPGGSLAYEHCRQLVAERDLHRLARRRPPGQAAWGERDPDGFLELAVRWAEGTPEGRCELMGRALAAEVPLEDAADMASLGAALLFLQETLGSGTELLAEEDLHRAVPLATGIFSLARLVRLGTPGQRILGLLLAGWIAPVREVRLLLDRSDRTWWLPSVRSLREPAATGEDGAPPPPAWARLVEQRQPNGLLPLLAERLEAGGTAGPIEGALIPLACALETAPGLSVRIARAFGEAYRASRAPQRWMHLWAASLALARWPAKAVAGGGEGRAADGEAPAAT